MEAKRIARRLSEMAKVMLKIINELDPQERAQLHWVQHIEENLLNLKGWVDLMNKEAEKMKKIYRYEGEYGVLEINLKDKKVIKDELNRKKIWTDTQENYIKRQNVYASIIEELLGEDVSKLFPPRYKNECWRGAPTNLGFKAINDEIEFVVDEEGVFIYDKEGWIISYSPDKY